MDRFGGEVPAEPHPYVDSALYDAIDQAWKSVPLASRREMLGNMQANLEMMSTDGRICSGTAMSGTDIMVHVTQCDLLYLHRELGYPKHILQPLFACDNDADVQGFLSDQFPDLPFLASTVAELSEFKAKNLLKKNEWRVIPDVELIGMGFVCTSLTKQSSKSKIKGASAVVRERQVLALLRAPVRW